jgi:hypothetical protein
MKGAHLWVASSGIVVAVASALDVLNQWAERAAKHDSWRHEMSKVLADSSSLSLADIDAALARHGGEVDDEIESLRVIAFNDVARSNGRDDLLRPLSLASRLCRFFL